LSEELIPLCIQETGVQRVATAGCSFGGYHAMNLAFRHPEIVKYVFNMSAAFDIKSQVNGFYNDDVYFNNPPDYIPDAWNDWFNDLYIVLGTGEFDICLDANIKMAEILSKKNIPHWLDIRPGANHDWPVWKGMFPHYVSLIK
jgi:esterase/lipase superfamily enzyme